MLRLSIVIVALAAVTQTAFASIGPGDGVLIVTTGVTVGETETDKEVVSGANFFLSYDKLDWERNSFMFMIGYIEAQDSTNTPDYLVGTIDDDVVNVNATTVPIYLGGKGWTGKGALQGYLGLGFGVYFTTVELTVPSLNTTSKDSMTGFGLGIPLGLTLSLGKTVLLNGNFLLNWLWSNSYYKNNLAYTGTVGIGLRFAD